MIERLLTWMPAAPAAAIALMPKCLACWLALGLTLAVRGIWRRRRTAVPAGAVLLLVALPSSAQTRPPEFKNPEERRSTGSELATSLSVRFARNQIGGTPVCLRSYEGMLVGPTLRAKPGDTLYVHLTNDLNLNPCGGPAPEPRSLVTNLHTHGLHVSPSGNSDNVLLELPPKQDFQYEIRIPKHHIAGTFWYHAHVHGSTAIQVSNSMAGAIIVDGGEKPSLDNVPEIRAAMARDREKIFVFQQVPYQQTGSVEAAQLENFLTGWQGETTINGQYEPVIRLRSGEVSRWRFIHAGVAASINVVLDGHQLHEIALDGLPRGRLVSRNRIELQPGYRNDVLVQAGAPGIYKLRDAASDAASSLQEGVAEAEDILATVIVEPGGERMSLPTSAQLFPYWPGQIYDHELEPPVQKVRFSMEGGKFLINGREYDPAMPPRKLILGSANAWEISAANGNHPFHIHVNPFQVMVPNERGVLEWVWRDTFLVRGGQSFVARSRYETYIGRFVLHCHNLFHEDRGMMELVEVALPGGPGMHDHGGHTGQDGEP